MIRRARTSRGFFLSGLLSGGLLGLLLAAPSVHADMAVDPAGGKASGSGAEADAQGSVKATPPTPCKTTKDCKKISEDMVCVKVGKAKQCVGSPHRPYAPINT